MIARPDPITAADFANNPLFSMLPDGRLGATLEGQAGGPGILPWPFGYLQSAPNYSSDQLNNLVYTETYPTPAGQTDTVFINNIVNASESYQNDLLYYPFPEVLPYTYNSNAYTAGILGPACQCTPIFPSSLSDLFKAPGFSTPIPPQQPSPPSQQESSEDLDTYDPFIFIGTGF